MNKGKITIHNLHKLNTNALVHLLQYLESNFDCWEATHKQDKGEIYFTLQDYVKDTRYTENAIYDFCKGFCECYSNFCEKK